MTYNSDKINESINGGGYDIKGEVSIRTTNDVSIGGVGGVKITNDSLTIAGVPVLGSPGGFSGEFYFLADYNCPPEFFSCNGFHLHFTQGVLMSLGYEGT